MSVAESMVMFGPIFQVGWASASSTVQRAMRSLVQVRKGPPEAVRMIFFTSRSPFPERRHWKIAECSLSTGRSGAPFSRASRRTIGPATTRDSLFERQRRFPRRAASTTAGSPAAPVTAARTAVQSLDATISH